MDESDNIASDSPVVRDTLIAKYKNWITSNKFAVPFINIDSSDITHPDPDPSGEVLDIKAWQKTNNKGEKGGKTNRKMSAKFFMR